MVKTREMKSQKKERNKRRNRIKKMVDKEKKEKNQVESISINQSLEVTQPPTNWFDPTVGSR